MRFKRPLLFGAILSVFLGGFVATAYAGDDDVYFEVKNEHNGRCLGAYGEDRDRLLFTSKDNCGSKAWAIVLRTQKGMALKHRTTGMCAQRRNDGHFYLEKCDASSDRQRFWYKFREDLRGRNFQASGTDSFLVGFDHGEVAVDSSPSKQWWLLDSKP